MEKNSFFKPTWNKGIFFIALMLSTFFIPKVIQICSNGVNGVACGEIKTFGFGYPMFYGIFYSGNAGTLMFNPITFVVNLVVFYLVSCGLIFLFGKIFKKK